MPLIAHLVSDEQIQIGHIRSGNYVHHPIEGARLVDIDTADTRVGVWAVQNATVEHTRQVDIGGVQSLTCGDRPAIDLGGPLADLLQFLFSCHSLYSLVMRIDLHPAPH